MPTKISLEDVRTLLVSLLAARPNYTALTVLDQDYFEVERNRIPWNKFGYCSLLSFLQSMPQYFEVANINNVNHVRSIAGKSKHVSSLVARQKNIPKHGISRHRSSYYPRVTTRSRPKISADKLSYLVQYVRSSPNGISINAALTFIQEQLPYVKLSIYDLQDQIREVGHQVYFDGDIIRPVMKTDSAPGTNIFRQCQSPVAVSEPPPVNMPEPSSSKTVFTVPEECSDFIFDGDGDEDGFVRPNIAHCSKQPKTDEQFMSSLTTKHLNYGETANHHDYHDNQEEKYDNAACSIDLNMSENESNNLANLISQRVQSRLQQLIQKYPDGIPCSELPNLYMSEFKMPLNYSELGFNSVCTFVSYLPDIFYLTRPDTNDDYILYSADKKPKEQDATGNDNPGTSKSFAQETTSTTKPINIPNSRFELRDMDDDDPFPSDLSPGLLDKFAPDDVVTYDNVSHISVTELQQDKKQYLEVYIVEVFTPTFFWIHLRQNRQNFNKFMDELDAFYEENYERYIIPKLGLKRGLNCACIYAGKWHRAIIKTVKPDFEVTVMFYDYGTQKIYSSKDVFYLVKEFFGFPAQAIPCGLDNVKPFTGDRWKKSITERFVEKIHNIGLLVATVVSVDATNNSMFINLTDTNEPVDVRINDWLVEENLARRGKMGDSIDIASLPKYVVNSFDVLPSYCFAEENPVIIHLDSCNKSTSTEEFYESPKVSSEPSFACHDNNQQSRSAPPGFALINEHVDRSSTQTNRAYVHSASGNITNTKTPSFSDLTEDITNITSDIFSNDVEKQMYALFMQENTALQIQLTNSFRCLLDYPPKTQKTCIDYTKLLFQFNNALKVLVNELDKRVANVTSSSKNNENDAGISSKNPHYNPNGESFMNQEAASSSELPRPQPSSFSSTANSFVEYHKQYHPAAASPTFDIKGFLYSSQFPPFTPVFRDHAHNFEQTANQVVVNSHQTDMNGPYVQSPSVTSSDPESSMFNRHRNVAKDTAFGNISGRNMPSSFRDLRKEMTNNPLLDINSKPSATNVTFFPTSSNVPLNTAEEQAHIEKLLHKSVLNTATASHANTSNINPSSSCHYSANEFANTYLQHEDIYKEEELTKGKLKETNPFRLYQHVEKQIPTRQSAYNYDMTNLASYLPNTNKQTYAPNMNESTNFRTTDHSFYGNTYKNTARNESNVNLSTGYRMHGDTVAATSDYTPRIVYEARPVMYNLQKKPEEQQLPPSQSTTQLRSNIVNNNDVDNVAPSSNSIDMSVLNDEGYVTPTAQTYNSSPPITNTENHYQPDINMNASSPPHVLPPWIMKSNNPLQAYRENSVSNTMYSSTNSLPYKEWSCESNKQFTIGDSCRTAEPSLSDDSEKAMMITCTNFLNSSLNDDQTGTTSCKCNTLLMTSCKCNSSLVTYFLFQRIDFVNGVTIIFHMDESGWMLTHEFVEAFTQLSKSNRLITLLGTINVSALRKDVYRFEYPMQFLQLDSYPLKVDRDSKNRIISLNLISLQAALGLLYKLKLISLEEVENTFSGNKITSNPVMFNIGELIIAYKKLKHRIEECDTDYGV